MFGLFKKKVTKEVLEQRLTSAYEMVENCLGDLSDRDKKYIVEDILTSGQRAPDRTEYDHAFGILSIKCLHPEASRFSKYKDNTEIRKKIFILFEECLNKRAVFNDQVIYSEIMGFYKEYKSEKN